MRAGDHRARLGRHRGLACPTASRWSARARTSEGVFHQFGFSAHGFQLGPGTGAVMAELVATGTTNVPIADLAIGRFRKSLTLSASAPPVVAQPREVHGDLADLGIGAQQGDLVGVDEQHLALGPVAGIVVGRTRARSPGLGSPSCGSRGTRLGRRRVARDRERLVRVRSRCACRGRSRPCGRARRAASDRDRARRGSRCGGRDRTRRRDRRRSRRCRARRPAGTAGRRRASRPAT